MNKKRITIIASLALIIGLYVHFDLYNVLNLAWLQSQHSHLVSLYNDNRAGFISIFFLTYVISAALALPAIPVLLTLAAGSIFGLVNGVIIVSFSSTLGATLAFLISRTLFQDYVKEKFPQAVNTINKGIDEEGAFYLLTLRLFAFVPFFVINLVMGLTSIRVTTYYWVSQIGMLAGTIVYVNLGLQLSAIESLAGLFDKELILAFALLGILPLLLKKSLPFLKKTFSSEST